MTRDGVEVVFASVAQCQYDIKAVVGVVQRCPVDYLREEKVVSTLITKLYTNQLTFCKMVWNLE